MTRGLILGDLHSGHHSSLIPPGSIFRRTPNVNDPVSVIQEELWRIYMEECVIPFKNPDFLFLIGDMIEGPGKKKGGTELHTTDRQEQVDIATSVLEYLNPKEVFGVLGTPFHTGSAEDWEQYVARYFDTKFGDTAMIRVEDVIFHLQHKVGRSEIPYGAFTPLARDKILVELRSYHKSLPVANVVVRGHVHYHAGCYGPGWEAFTTAALCGDKDKFGTRQCKAEVHFGFTEAIIDGPTWHLIHHIYVLESTKPPVYEVGKRNLNKIEEMTDLDNELYTEYDHSVLT